MAKNEEKDLFGGKADPKAQAQAEPKAEPKAQVQAEPKAEPKTEPKTEPKAGDRIYVYNASGRDMRDPHTGDRFPVGRTVRVRDAGGWTLSQIAAGLFRIGSADDVGEEPENNSDFLKDQASKQEQE